MLGISYLTRPGLAVYFHSRGAMSSTPLLCCVTVLVLLCGVPAANAAVQHNSVNDLLPQGDAVLQMAKQANEMGIRSHDESEGQGVCPIAV